MICGELLLLGLFSLHLGLTPSRVGARRVGGECSQRAQPEQASRTPACACVLLSSKLLLLKKKFQIIKFIELTMYIYIHV